MLVITRRNGESIQIGPDITVVVLRAADNSVRLGFDAPRGVTIMRTELLGEKTEPPRPGPPGPRPAPPPPGSFRPRPRPSTRRNTA
jgi:carbon storage regulator CsrA